MTAAQTKLYWREWGAVHRARPDADRHALHLAALGYECSSKRFTNAEFDKVLAEFRAVSDPANLGAQLRQQRQPKTRLLWKIEHEQRACLAIYVEDAESYIMALARDKFRADALRHLTVAQLEHLRSTLARAIGRLRAAAGHTGAEMRARAGIATPAAHEKAA